MANNNKPKSKAPAKRPSKKVAEQIALEEMQRIKKNKDIAAIILLVAGIITFLLSVIKGESGWLFAHNFVIGFSGLCAFIFPFLLIYLALMLSFDKFSKSVTPKIIEVVVLMLLLSSSIYVFKSYNNEIMDKYFSVLKQEYLACNPLGGGLIGTVLGFPLAASLGPTGAKIITVVGTLTDIMIMTGTTVSKLLLPAKKFKEKATESKEERKQRRENSAYPNEIQNDNAVQMKPDFNVPIEEPKADVLTGKKPKKAKSKISVDDDDDPETRAIKEIFQTEKDRKKNREAQAKVEEKIKNDTENEILDAAKASVAPLASIVGTVNSPKEPVVEEQGDETSYKLPSPTLLNVNKKNVNYDPSYEMQQNSQILVDTLTSFGVDANIVNVTRGPSVTRYDLKPAVGVRISKITNLSDDIALNLATSGIRIAPIPNKAAIGIEVPNKNKNTVGLRELLESDKFDIAKSKKLTVALGENIAGEPQYADLSKMPHLLIAGTTGSGKSVCLNSMIISILFNATPDQVKFIMIDPKGVELSVYNGIPHMLIDVVKNPHKAAGALAWAVKEMMNRYALFESLKVRDIKSYNKAVSKMEDVQAMSQVVIVIDELADLMMVSPSEVEDSICRLAQMARAAGMHLVIATQSPRADVITGLIKANIPSRIALKVSNGLDSRIIIDQNGAEKLLGNGDMLFNPVGANKPTRIQGCYVSDAEIEKVVSYIKNQESAEYDEEIENEISAMATQDKSKKSAEISVENNGDELIPKAIEIILETGTASTSFLQRRLSVGYARGARIIDELEEMGIIGPADGAKPRKILITKQQWLERNATSPNDQLCFNALGDEGTEDE